MSADNSVARSGRDADLQAKPPAFEIPPDLAKRYEVRIVQPADGSERRVGLFLPRDRENPSIEIAGDRIVARDDDPETVSSLVQIAKHNGWAGIDVEGSPEFRQTVWTAASREGLTVRGYEPKFDQQARMEQWLRAEATRREREAARPAPIAEHVAPSPAVETAVAPNPVRSAETDRSDPPEAPPGSSSTEVSDADKRLLLTLSVYTQDRKALHEDLRGDLDPLHRQIQNARIGLNTDALNGALDRALASPTLVRSFSSSGYEPDDLRGMAREAAWEEGVADAIYRVRSGLNRFAVRENDALESLRTEPAGEREDRLIGSRAAPEEQPEPGAQVPRGERQRDAGIEQRRDNEQLAELFLHGGAERIAAEPRLAGALQAQAAIERHLGAAFDGEADRMASANLESRHLISDVLRRGLDVSVREPTPIRQGEPIQPTHDLAR